LPKKLPGIARHHRPVEKRVKTVLRALHAENCATAIVRAMERCAVH